MTSALKLRQRRLVILLVLVPILWLWHVPHSGVVVASTAGHLDLGNPTNAVTDPATPTNYLIARGQYALSYNRDIGIPNWAAWHLGATDLGSTPRGDFQTDNSLPADWYRVQPGDYTGSGYDRGHMTPSGDRTASRADNDATFLMTNILPQAPDNNQGPWERLESYSRSLVQSGNELYIVSGGSGVVGTLANGRVRIPARTWKVIVVLSEGSDDLARVTTSTRVIAVDMPNVQGIRTTPWESYRTTVDAIEAMTSYDFLSQVDPAIQAALESRVDGSPAAETATVTSTATATGISTATTTHTATVPATSTAPPTETATATTTNTSTATVTATATATGTRTSTAIATTTATSTDAATEIPTATPTSVLTSSATPTVASTITSTVPATPMTTATSLVATTTATAPATATRSPSATPSASITAVFAATAVGSKPMQVFLPLVVIPE